MWEPDFSIRAPVAPATPPAPPPAPPAPAPEPAFEDELLALVAPASPSAPERKRLRKLINGDSPPPAFALPPLRAEPALGLPVLHAAPRVEPALPEAREGMWGPCSGLLREMGGIRGWYAVHVHKTHREPGPDCA